MITKVNIGYSNFVLLQKHVATFGITINRNDVSELEEYFIEKFNDGDRIEEMVDNILNITIPHFDVPFADRGNNFFGSSHANYGLVVLELVE